MENLRGSNCVYLYEEYVCCDLQHPVLDAFYEELHKPTVACLPLVTALSYVCLLIQICPIKSRCGRRRGRGAMRFRRIIELFPYNEGRGYRRKERIGSASRI